MSPLSLVVPDLSPAGRSAEALVRALPSRVVAHGNGIDRDHALRNRLLGALPRDDFDQLRPRLERVVLEQGDVIFEPGEPIQFVYFPETAVVSLVGTMRGGTTAEVGTAGHEGIAGLPLFLGNVSSTLRAFTQIPGVALRLSAADFVRFSSMPGALHRGLLRYTQTFLTQIAQTAACNGAHFLEARCARWLLTTCDRVDGNEFPMTHEFMAFTLGVRRVGVTITMRAIEDAGIIRHERDRVEILDRSKLEEISCECYGVVRAHMERLLPPSNWS